MIEQLAAIRFSLAKALIPSGSQMIPIVRPPSPKDSHQFATLDNDLPGTPRRQLLHLPCDMRNRTQAKTGHLL
jgi:hypothetical protein